MWVFLTHLAPLNLLLLHSTVDFLFIHFIIQHTSTFVFYGVWVSTSFRFVIHFYHTTQQWTREFSSSSTMVKNDIKLKSIPLLAIFWKVLEKTWQWFRWLYRVPNVSKTHTNTIFVYPPLIYKYDTDLAKCLSDLVYGRDILYLT